jgi:integrase
VTAVGLSSAAFAWAVKRGIQTNPFVDLPVSKGIAKRERVLNHEEVGERQAAILTGQRRGEVAGMTWREISEDLSTWTMPGERTKNGLPHVVPLSGPARDLLRGLLPEDDADAKRRVTSGKPHARASRAFGHPVRPLVEGEDRARQGRCGSPCQGWAAAGTSPIYSIAPWSIHDLRRAVATGLQRLGIRLEVTEAVLNLDQISFSHSQEP